TVTPCVACCVRLARLLGRSVLNGGGVINQTPSMQDYTSEQCASEAAGAAVALADKRDGKEYTVRYINGDCWMTQNLALEPGATLTPADSNVSSDYTLPTTQLGNGGSVSEAQITCSENADYGCYYNYVAATAGTIKEGDESEATSSICPAGWKLPSSETDTLIPSPSGDYDTDSTYVEAFNPITSGVFNSYQDKFYDVGSEAIYWRSGVAYDTARLRLAYFTDFNGESGLSTYYYEYADYGASVLSVLQK
ncbi:MAG: FISUMP domain-containing protein, partial [Candidatus Saccharibacteria bacterium]|nr:FISUMP domain-containing protein [Candidatus Saccharibacteria bacterium]